MAALYNDKFKKVGFSTATSLGAPGHLIGGTSITVGSTTNWPTDTGVTFAIDRVELVGGEEVQVAGSYTLWQGTVTGATTIANMVIHANSPNSDQNYSAGSLTRVYIPISAGLHNDVMDGILTHADQDGTLKADSVDVTAVIKDNVVSNAKLSEFKPSEVVSDFIASGGVVAQSAGLVGTFSNMVHYINGVRCTKTSVANKTYTASKDTYVDADATNNATVVYTEVANGAASPALSANHIRVAKVVTNGSAITSVVQGGSDSLGNTIYNTDAHRQAAWRTWTPIWTSTGTAPAIGNGTLTGAYTQIGKTVHFRFKFVGGSTTTWGTGSYLVTLPTALWSGAAANDGIILSGYAEDNTVAGYNPIGGRLYDTTRMYVNLSRSLDGVTTAWGQATPFTWGTGDYISASGTYEAA